MRFIFFAVSLLSALLAYSQDMMPIILPEIEINDTKHTGDVISREDMDRTGAKDLSEAVKFTPGIILTDGGARGETNFKVRGFGADSVPIYVDGIVLANPYRGEGDASRLLTGDLESINIQKGYSSTLLGPNNLGGAVVMRTAKPKKELELQLESSLDLDSRFKYADSFYVAGVGTRQSFYYARAVLQYRDIDHFRLPHSFVPVKDNPQEKGNRLWSGSKDLKATLMAGLTPTDTLDIWATYIYQDSDKGLAPPETNLTRGYRVWEWPFWRRESISLNADYNSRRFYAKLLAYFDKYDNRMWSYYNMDAYNFGVHLPPSDYDEYSEGARMEMGVSITQSQKGSIAFTYKKEDHKGITDGRLGIHVNEDTLALGGEYRLTLSSKLTLAGGVGFDALMPRKYWSSENDLAIQLGPYSAIFVVRTANQWLLNGQMGVFYEFLEGEELHLTYARKNHFPTMSQRYSTRFGDVLPNPGLKPETADHVELGYIGAPIKGLSVNAAVYRSIMVDKIVTVEIADPTYPTVAVDFSRNLDSTAFYGGELGVKYRASYASLGLTYSLNRYTIKKDKSGEVKKLDYYPEITANAYIEIYPTENITLTPSMEYVGERYADTAALYRLESYILYSFKAESAIGDYLTLRFSVNNITDELYETRQYYPQAGRAFSLSAKLNY